MRTETKYSPSSERTLPREKAEQIYRILRFQRGYMPKLIQERRPYWDQVEQDLKSTPKHEYIQFKVASTFDGFLSLNRIQIQEEIR